MEERIGEVFADAVQLTVMGKQLHAGSASLYWSSDLVLFLAIPHIRPNSN